MNDSISPLARKIYPIGLKQATFFQAKVKPNCHTACACQCSNSSRFKLILAHHGSEIAYIDLLDHWQ